MSVVVTQPAYHVEFFGGREVEKPLPKNLHIFIQMFLLVTLERFLPRRYRVLPELNVLTGGVAEGGRREYIVPDVVVTVRGATYVNGDLAQAPLLGIEILSPGQTITELFVRGSRMLSLGTSRVWIIWPERRRAWVQSADDLVEAGDHLAAPLLDGDSVAIETEEMWAALEDSDSSV